MPCLAQCMQKACRLEGQMHKNAQTMNACPRTMFIEPISSPTTIPVQVQSPCFTTFVQQFVWNSCLQKNETCLPVPVQLKSENNIPKTMLGWYNGILESRPRTARTHIHVLPRLMVHQVIGTSPTQCLFVCLTNCR